MSDKKYLIGIDFGTLSGRAIVVDAADGTQLGTAVTEYPHAVMDRTLTAGDGRELPPEFALQDPADYMKVLAEAVPGAVKDAGVDPADIVGIGVDATSATVFFTDEDGTPLCQKPGFENNIHAWVKLWKHHGAQDQADRLVQVAKARREPWLARYGGVLSSELLLPKVLEVFEMAPEVYEEADVICNLLDWLTWKMTGTLTQAAGDSGYKRMYQDGQYPSHEYLEAVKPGFGNVFDEKMSAPILPLGGKVGGLTAEMAELMGLKEGTAVASGNIDAHVVVAGANAVRPGQLTAILGTSSCYVVNGEELRDCPGVFGIVDGGAVDGYWGFEGGQTAVGDIFAWFIDTQVPGEYFDEAKNRGISIHDLLVEKAKKQKVGEHGLVALDWQNGNRSILADARLSGMVIGQTLVTRPEDTYRALLEATAFGCRVIIDNFEEHGVKVDEIVAAGGLLKNQFYMQLLADITRRPITVSESDQTGALGSAVFAAVAAGVYPDVFAAADAMASVRKNAYVPTPENSEQYDGLYEIYKELHDFFGRYNGVSPMHRLKNIRDRVRGGLA
ncbi:MULTISPECIES: ribulokinase [unclassified Actinobaculum]|uniref:ribulokinase n=1 Tax=unclassified Actinobaculum TaxID=2609299 RepID=UPI000D528B7C|nr:MULTISPECIES: ribulokinase [unclassified Actinobaculum]AWE42969.1 ribulokinase [Actinobaculum sp. 313]RTE48943.1 ribulokinase [Actinobaculum sp. 352]